MEKDEALYGLVAEFDTAAGFLGAVRAARAEGYACLDAYAPFPVDGLAEALGLSATRLPYLVLAAGLLGALLGFALQYHATALDYPLNVGGRPLNSWPAFMPVAFELALLFAGLAAFGGMLLGNRQPDLYHPLFNVPDFRRASQDRFFLCIEADDLRFDAEAVRCFLLAHGALEVFEVAP